MSRTIFIGDIHGCSRQFEALLDLLAFQRGHDRLLLTGDAFARGLDPRGVWKAIVRTGAEMVLGNHEQRLMDWLPRHADEGAPAPKTTYRRNFRYALGPDAVPILTWIKQLPLWIETESWLLVHAGIHPKEGLVGTTRAELLEIRTWPPKEGFRGRRWHDYLHPSAQIIVFGHDAPRGLVLKRQRDGRPFVVGLDTGCVYGGRLTAYVLEEDCIVQA